MRNKYRIAIGILVGIFFAAGYSARTQQISTEKVIDAQTSRSAPTYALENRIAAIDLEGAADVDFRPIETLYSVVKNLREHYVEQLTLKDEGKMTYDALKAMLNSLNDPNTKFLEPDQRKIVADAMVGKFHGIGAILDIKRIKADGLTDEQLIVVTPLTDSPAAKAGLQPGDRITAIDGKSVLSFDPFQKANKIIKDARNKKTQRIELQKQLEGEQKRIENGVSIMEAENTLTSEDKKSIELTVIPNKSAKETKIKIQPSEFTVNPVTSSLTDNDKYGYIKIDCFTISTSEKFSEAMKSLQGKNVSGLVLDLRNLSSGGIDSALQVAKWFAPGKKFAIVAKSHNRKSTIKIPALDGSVWKKPVVVLVNAWTARTPEVLAAALKDNNVAKLVGEKTYGDSVEATLIDQGDGSAIMMTTGKYLTSGGKDFSGKGLSVDVEAASSQPDNQLKEAVKLLSSAQAGVK